MSFWKNVKETFGIFEKEVKKVKRGPPNAQDISDVISRVGGEQEEVGQVTSKAVKKTVRKVGNKLSKWK